MVFPRKKEIEDVDNAVLSRRITHLETALKLMDADLQDAIDGFYRRRQADRMREIRQEDAAAKPKRLTDRDILARAVDKLTSSKEEE